MSPQQIDRIRDKIRLRQYDMSAHAMEEMAEDKLDIIDVETAILNGNITHRERDDPRGTKYIVEGLALDKETPVATVGRFAAADRYVIITVYVVD